MALFGHVCKHITSINGTSFIAIIEVLSRKNGKQRFLVYGAFCPLPPLSLVAEVHEDPQYIYTECTDMRNAEVVFNEYRRSVISCFSLAPYGFRRFIDRWTKRRELEVETVFDYFPRWVKEGKKSGRRRGAKAPKTLKLEFGNPHQILGLRQRELALKENYLANPADEMTPEEICTLEAEITFLRQEVVIARDVLKRDLAQQ